MDFQEEIKKLLDTGFEPDANPTTWEADCLADIKESISKLDKRQRETIIHMESLQELLEQEQSDDEEAKAEAHTQMLTAIVAILDYVDDFYAFAARDKNSPLFQQAEMMRNGALKKIAAIGLTQVCDEKTEFNSDLNTIEATEENPDLPAGTIIKTFQSGYLYNGNVVRKSKVVVNKNETRN